MARVNIGYAAAIVMGLMALGGVAHATEAEDAFVDKMIRNSENCHAIYAMASEERPAMAASARTMQATARGVYRLYSGKSDAELEANLAETEGLWRKYIGNGEYDLDKQIKACDHHFHMMVAQHNRAAELGIRPTLDLDVPEMHETAEADDGGMTAQCQAIADDFEMRASEMSYTIRDAAEDPSSEKAEYFRKYGADYLHDKFEDHLASARDGDCPSDLIEALVTAIDILEPLAD
ncbi:hypothetical protein ABI_42450 [Asticcacaulis biprosthecium C19]|uniref:Uncharacterized protein n=2 Tax=Asticcacaulis biprosthecium TaxID=76891 RepID=F4QSV2_9CAUL|nr:hypothetical protein ABI_42450 [Asticcacaulis biprosthecium C19]